MESNIVSARASDLCYAHRVPDNAEMGSFLPLCKRVALTALPFIGLYKPAGMIVSVGSELLGIGSNATNLYEALRNGEGAFGFSVRTVVGIASVASTILAHPLGLFISGGYDTIASSRHLTCRLQNREYAEAAEEALQLVNTALYLSVLVYGSLELSIASLCLQTLTSLYRSRGEFLQGRYPEGAGHAGMALVKGYKLSEQVYFLRLRREIEKLFDEQNTIDLRKTASTVRTVLKNLSEILLGTVNEENLNSVETSILLCEETSDGKKIETILTAVEDFTKREPSFKKAAAGSFRESIEFKSFVLALFPENLGFMNENIASFLTSLIYQDQVLIHDETVAHWASGKPFKETENVEGVGEEEIQKLMDRFTKSDGTPYALLACLLSGNFEKIEAVNRYVLTMSPRKSPPINTSNFGSFITTLVYSGSYDDFSATVLTTMLYRCKALSPQAREHLLQNVLPFEGNEFSHKTPYVPFLEETENHILMINSSRYLKNRYLRMTGRFEIEFDNERNGLEARLLDKLQCIKANGPDEYNSLPYAAYSIHALLNLYEFGSLPVQLAAKDVLDELATRYADASCGMKNFSPFRRQTKKGSDQSLFASYQLHSLYKWLSATGNPVPTELEKQGRNSTALIPACTSYRLPQEIEDRLTGRDPTDYFTQIGRSATSIGGSPEIYYGGHADGQKYLLSAGGAYPTGIYRDKREIMTRQITLLTGEAESNLSDLFYIGKEDATTNPCKEAYARNNTGVYHNFACGAGPVHVPKTRSPVEVKGEWSLYKAGENLFVAVYSKETLGIMAVFHQNAPDGLLDAVARLNAEADVLEHSFSFPQGTALNYNVNASQDTWVMQSRTDASGNVESFETDFSKWDSYHRSRIES